jgi:hypothetical protein
MCLHVLSSVLWCPFRYRIQMMFRSYLPPVICRRAHVLLLIVHMHIGTQNGRRFKKSHTRFSVVNVTILLNSRMTPHSKWLHVILITIFTYSSLIFIVSHWKLFWRFYFFLNTCNCLLYTVFRIYPNELGDTQKTASYLGLHIEIDNGGRLRTTSLFISNISQLIRYSRAFVLYSDFSGQSSAADARATPRRLRYSRVIASKFYGRHHNLFEHSEISISQMTMDLFLFS